MAYVDVPEVDADALIDPHWQELRRSAWGLPESYMPPAMGGHHAAWTRAAAWLLIVIFLTATTGGICLTYGPSHWSGF